MADNQYVKENPITLEEIKKAAYYNPKHPNIGFEMTQEMKNIHQSLFGQPSPSTLLKFKDKDGKYHHVSSEGKHLLTIPDDWEMIFEDNKGWGDA